MDDKGKPILSQLISLVGFVVYLWLVIPTHHRQSLQLRAWHAARVACRHAARVTGRSSMRVELSCGTRRYELPLALSLASDWCSRAYDRTRGFPV
jgi:hypothetical protein